jgi:hypothetical protein
MFMEHVALIYKILVLSIMIDQMNMAVQRLDLPQTSVTSPRQLKECDVFAPEADSYVPRGYVRTDKYHFAGFAKGICLFRLNSGGSADWPDPFSDEGATATNANKAIAYDLSRGWLEAVGVDVQALERIHKPTIEQGVSHAKSRKLVSPNFHVYWGRTADKTGGHSVVEVQLDAAKKWLVALYVNDLSFWKQPIPAVTNGWGISLLPDKPVLPFLEKPGLEFTNAFKLLEIPPTELSERRQKMLLKIGQLVDSLEIRSEIDLEESRAVSEYVNPPAFGQGGAFQFKDCQIRFSASGELSHLSYLPKRYTNSLDHLQAPLIISSNRAFEIATETLASLGIEVERLNRDLEHQFKRAKWVKESGKAGRQWFDTSEFHFRWARAPAGPAAPNVQVDVFGGIGKVGRFEINDASYFSRTATETGKPPPN